MTQEQSLKNHARVDPLYHFVLSPLALILMIAAVVDLVRNPGWTAVFYTLAGVWAAIATLKIRLYALKVQDRVIRLEERLRLYQVLPAELKSRVPELSEAQLIALRFACDTEVGDLATKTLGERWSGRQIKEAIRSWRPDYWRV